MGTSSRCGTTSLWAIRPNHFWYIDHTKGSEVRILRQTTRIYPSFGNTDTSADTPRQVWRLGYGITTARAEVIYARWMQVITGWSTVPVLLPVRGYYSTVLRYCTILLHSRIAFARRQYSRTCTAAQPVLLQYETSILRVQGVRLP